MVAHMKARNNAGTLGLARMRIEAPMSRTCEGCVSQRAAHEADIASRGVDFAERGWRGNPGRAVADYTLKVTLPHTTCKVLGFW